MPEMYSGAELSDCLRYRYCLWRRWGVRDELTFIMLNPSTADAHEDDPTIRRCVSFAQREGFDGIKVLNLFAGRATDPKELFKMEDPVGPDWSSKTYFHIQKAGPIVVAWGAKSNILTVRQSQLIRDYLGKKYVLCFGKTKDGHPKHPLYLKKDQLLERWE